MRIESYFSTQVDIKNYLLIGAGLCAFALLIQKVSRCYHQYSSYDLETEQEALKRLSTEFNISNPSIETVAH